MKLGPLVAVLAVGLALVPAVHGLSRSGAPPVPKPRLLQRVYVNMPSLPRARLVDLATDVVVARVLEKRPVFPAEGMAYTEFDLDVYWSLKASTDDRVTIRVAGAEEVDRHVIVDRAPAFATGEEAVLCLWRDEATGTYSILGLDLGTFRIAPDTLDRASVFGLETAGVELFDFLQVLNDEWAATSASRR